MKKTLLLTLAAGLAVSGVVRADTAAAPAAAAPAATAAPAAAADTNTAAAMPAVAKNDNPGSLKQGNELLDAGKYAEAANYFTGIGEQSSVKREPYRLLGLSTALLESGKYDDAIATAQKAIDAKKDLSGAWNNLAAAQARSGKRDDAIATYDKAEAALKAAGADTKLIEANEAALKAAIEAGKPKKVREAEAKAKAAADKAAADAMTKTAAAAAPAAAAPAAAAPAAAASTDSK
jgi:tetratricopeptide (TPR) repeat protein